MTRNNISKDEKLEYLRSTIAIYEKEEDIYKDKKFYVKGLIYDPPREIDYYEFIQLLRSTFNYIEKHH